MAEIICPICGTPNPEGSTFCWSCSARLRDSGNSNISANSNPSADENDAWLDKFQERAGKSTSSEPEDENVPEWLARIRARTQLEHHEEADDLIPSDEAGEEKLPEWMQEISMDVPPNPPADQPETTDESIDQTHNQEKPPEDQIQDEPKKVSSLRKRLSRPGSEPQNTPPTESSRDDTDEWLQHLSTWKPPIPEAAAAALESVLPALEAESEESMQEEEPIVQPEELPKEVESILPTGELQKGEEPVIQSETFQEVNAKVLQGEEPQEEQVFQSEDFLRIKESVFPEEKTHKAEESEIQPGDSELEEKPIQIEELTEKEEQVTFPEETAPEFQEIPTPIPESPIENPFPDFDLPDWLTSINEKPSGENEKTPLEQTPDLKSADSLDQLAEASLTAAGLKTGSLSKEEIVEDLPVPTSNGETPDWLEELDSMKPGVTKTPSLPNEPGFKDQELLENISAENAFTDTEFLSKEEETTPSVSEAIDYETPASTEPQGEDRFGGEEIPEWLKNIHEPVGEILPNPAATPALVFDIEPAEEKPDDTLPFASEDVPEWLTMVPTGTETSQKQEISSPGIAPAELPEWLNAMRPMGMPASEIEHDRVENSGPLAGYRGVLPGNDAATQYSRPPAYSSRLHITERQRVSSEVFEAIMAEESLVTPDAIPVKKSNMWLLRLVLGLVLSVVLLAILISGSSYFSLPALFPAENVRVSDAIRGLPEGAPVLVGLEYEPALVGELEPAAILAIEQLMQRNVRLTFISTSPSGQVLAADLLERASVSQTSYSIDEQTVILGYLAGSTTGLQEFVRHPGLSGVVTLDQQNPWTTPALAGVDSLNDFSLVLLLTDNPETTRAWMEQVQPAIPITPFMVITSALAAPLTRPYLDSGQVDGMISGLLGAAAYEQIIGHNGLARTYWDAYQVGITTVIVLIITGMILQWTATILSRFRIRRK